MQSINVLGSMFFSIIVLCFLCSGQANPNPGYGFHSDYNRRHQYPGGQAANGVGGGFWTGMGTGGMLGYLFERQRSVRRHVKRLCGMCLKWVHSKLLGCFFICACSAETSHTATTTPVTGATERPLLETNPLPLAHALLQVPKDDKLKKKMLPWWR